MSLLSCSASSSKRDSQLRLRLASAAQIWSRPNIVPNSVPNIWPTMIFFNFFPNIVPNIAKSKKNYTNIVKLVQGIVNDGKTKYHCTTNSFQFLGFFCFAPFLCQSAPRLETLMAAIQLGQSNEMIRASEPRLCLICHHSMIIATNFIIIIIIR